MLARFDTKMPESNSTLYTNVLYTTFNGITQMSDTSECQSLNKCSVHTLICVCELWFELQQIFRRISTGEIISRSTSAMVENCRSANATHNNSRAF